MTRLNTIKKYNPQSMKDEDLVNQFILRLKPYTTIIESIKSYDNTGTPQHFLIIAQRGMGKSTLLKRVEIELRLNDHLSTSFFPILLPEEVYNIETLSKFWKKVLDSLLDYLENTDQQDELKKWEESVEEITTSHTEIEVYQLFNAICKSLDKKPVLIIDNIHQLFSGLSEEDNWSLRSRLTGPVAPILISASPTAPNVFSDYSQAFYDYFKVLHLDPINDQEFNQLTKYWVESFDDAPRNNEFIQNRQRLEALFKLSGGNLRTVIMLFTKMATGFGDKIEEDLVNLLDEVTPYYKARIEELSEQARNIVDAAALHWDPIDIKQLMVITGLGSNVLSPQIKRLRAAGWITNIESKKSKGDKYELVERFYNIWHIMRSSTRKEKRAVKSLACFIEIYYGKHLDEYASQLLDKKIRTNDDLSIYVATSIALKNKNLLSQLESKILDEAINLTHINQNLKEEISQIKEKYETKNVNSAWVQTYLNLFNEEKFLESRDYLLTLDEKQKQEALYWFFLGEVNSKLKEYQKSESAYLKAIEIDPVNAIPLNGLGNLYQIYLNEYEKSESAYLKAIEIDSKFAYPWNGLGNLYQIYLNEYEKSEGAYQKAIEINPNFAYPWNGLGNLYQDYLNEYEKSESAYLKAIEIDPNYANPWNELGNLYQNYLNEYEKSESAYLKAIEIDPNFAYPWNGLGNLYQDYLNEYEKSESAYFKAIEIDPNYAYSWIGLGNLYQNYLNDYEKSESAYIKAIQIDPNDAYPWNGLGNLYQHYLNEYEKAESAYLKAIEIDPNFAHPWNELGNLYQDYLNEYEKSESAYLKAIQIDSNYAYPWNGLGNLFKNYLNEYEKSESAYLRAIEIDPNYAYPWNGLGNLYQDYLNEYEKAKEAYQRAIELDYNIVATYNLIFLLRDKLNKYHEAKKVFDTMSVEDDLRIKDSYYLNQSLFHIYDQNFGLASASLSKAIECLSENKVIYTLDDWMRYIMVAIKNGFGIAMLEVFKKSDFSITMRPLYEASVALFTKDEMYFNELAVEVRTVARDIYDKMKKMA
jgi:tetratricopeptide (TPR) repeat protein